MKNIVFVHGGDVMAKETPVRERSSETYKTFFTMGKKQGLRMVWSNLKYFDAQRNIFTAYVFYNGKEWEKVSQDINPDFIYDLSCFRYDRVPAKKDMLRVAPYLNSVELKIIASDKMLTYLTFPDEVYPMIPVSTQSDIIKSIDAINSDIVVLKPVYGSAGNGIEFLSKEEAKKFNPQEPYLLQEFIDGSHGIPGVYKGLHDLRLMFLGNELFQAYYRTNAPGTYLCNVSQGGQLVLVPIEKLPESVMTVASKICKRFEYHPNSFFTIDFLFNKEGVPKVLELNCSPSLGNQSGNTEHVHHMYECLLEHIQKYV